MQPYRRDFLKMSLGAGALLWLKPTTHNLLCGASLDNVPQSDNVLVLVELSGGNDGLNTIVPYGDDEYYRKRPTIALPANQVHKIDSMVGFHPRTQALLRLHDEGLLSIVRGVGYPNPDGDHAVSLRYWQTARPHESSCQTGWLGRAIDSVHRSGEPDVPAVFVGNTRQPLTLNAETTIVPSLRGIHDWTMRGVAGAKDIGAHRESISALASLPRDAGNNSLLDVLQRGMLSACKNSEKIEAVIGAEPHDAGGAYPPYQLAQTFRAVARLIRADLGIRIFCTELGGDGFGGFDNHANQLGNHGALLHQLSESVASFVSDLREDGSVDRVLLMTYSEFGRTVAENGRRGTDHGSAAPMFLAGGRLKGGLVGEQPNLTELENGGLKFHTDFRRVYTTVLDHWLHIDSQAALSERFQPLELFGRRS